MASFTPNRGYTPNALGMAVTSTASRKRKREDEKSVLGGSFVIKVTTQNPPAINLEIILPQVAQYFLNIAALFIGL